METLINNRFSLVTATILVLITGLLSSCATTLSVDNTKSLKHPIPIKPISDWIERKFVGATDYKLKVLNNKNVLSASSNASASMLYKKVKIDLNKTPYINWKWLVNNTISSNNIEKTRNGDDFAARIYIAIKPAALDIKPRAITYVWANQAKQFDSWHNPYNNGVVMLALQSGNSNSKHWVNEKRNLKQDLEQYFNEPINSIVGIALMSDSDNTKAITNALYSDLFFSTD